MNSKTIQYIGLGAIAYIILTNLGGWLAQKISIGSIKVKLGSTTAMGQNMTLYIPVINSAPVSYPFEGFQGLLRWGQNPLAQILINQPITITASDTTTIPVQIFVPFANLGTQLIDIIASGNWLAGATIQGTLRAGGMNVPISQPIQLL